MATTPWLGSYLALVGVCLLLPPLWGERRWRLIVPYALIFPTLIMLLFAKVLKVYFEPGVLRVGVSLTAWTRYSPASAWCWSRSIFF